MSIHYTHFEASLRPHLSDDGKHYELAENSREIIKTSRNEIYLHFLFSFHFTVAKETLLILKVRCIIF